MRLWTLACLGALVGAACAPESAAPPAAGPRIVETPGLSAAEDRDPAPDSISIALQARLAWVEPAPGRRVEAWTYDGRLPGPLIRGRAGDRLVVDFENALPAPTTIHWHGLRVPNEMDGVPDHPNPAIAAGGRSRYEFVLPDPGTYWYHPHVSSAAQVGYGLYGPLIVDDPAEPPIAGDEHVLVLSDLHLDADGRLADPRSGGELGTLFGREGELLLVNGLRRPTLPARVGVPLRLRLINAAKSRYFQLELPGHDFTIIGVDGGRIPAPRVERRPVLAAAERLDVVLLPSGEPGARLPLMWLPYDRGYGTVEFRTAEPILELALEAATPVALAIPEAEVAPLELVATSTRTLRLTRGRDAHGGLVLGIDDVPFHDAPPLETRVGRTEIWTIVNEIEWAHPFHLHGFFFQVLDAGGRPIRAWKDTVDVPVRGRVRFAVRFDARPGMWMFHCHVLDHAEAGMMGLLHVAP